MKNVNSEISMRMVSNDKINYYKILKELSDKEGNLFNDGFGVIEISKWKLEQLQKWILEFHKKYYVSNLMSIVIISD